MYRKLALGLVVIVVLAACSCQALQQLQDRLGSVSQTIKMVERQGDELEARLEKLPPSEARQKALKAVDQIESAVTSEEAVEAATRLQEAIAAVAADSEVDLSEGLGLAGEAVSTFGFLSPWAGVAGVVLGLLASVLSGNERRKRREVEKEVQKMGRVLDMEAKERREINKKVIRLQEGK